MSLVLPENAVVTGAANGIGRALAAGLARAGVKVLAIDVEEHGRGDDSVGLVSLVDQVRRDGGWIEARVCDVRDVAGMQAVMAKTSSLFGHVESVLCCAGVLGDAADWDLPEESWDRVVDINLKGQFSCVSAFLPSMVAAGRGTFLFFASYGGVVTGAPRFAAYCAGKAGVVGYMRSVAAALQGTGVNAVAVLPGADTRMSAMTARALKKERTGPSAPDRVPGSLLPAVQFLVSNRSAELNGQTFAVVGRQMTHVPHPTYGESIWSEDDWTAEDVDALFAAKLAGRLTEQVTQWPPQRR